MANFFGRAALLALLPSVLSGQTALREQIVKRAADVPGAVIGVAFHDLQTGDTLYLNADDSFHAASTMKVPVMIELFRRVDAAALTLDQGVLLVNQVRIDRRRVALLARSRRRLRQLGLSSGRTARAAPRADRPHDHALEQPCDERADRARRRQARQRHGPRARRAEHPGAARRRGRQGVSRGPEQHDDRARSRGAARGDRDGPRRVARELRRDARRAAPPGVQRRDSGRPAAGHARSRTRRAGSPACCTTPRSSIRADRKPYVLVVLTRGHSGREGRARS